MFPAAAGVLKSREGQLAETPLPLLLQALRDTERTCVVELRLRQVEKRIAFEEGSPVGCRSNLLHETLGKFLVARGKLAEADYQRTLSESVQTGKEMGELLVTRGLVPPFELFKQMQASTALAILDCFRWPEGHYRLFVDEGELTSPAVRMNSAQLIFTGVTGSMPFDAVCTHFAFTDEQRFARTPLQFPE
jgi:hypothetical protein